MKSESNSQHTDMEYLTHSVHFETGDSPSGGISDPNIGADHRERRDDALESIPKVDQTQCFPRRRCILPQQTRRDLNSEPRRKRYPGGRVGNKTLYSPLLLKQIVAVDQFLNVNFNNTRVLIRQ